MSYKQKTIANILEEINRHEILLPSIQRKYVWDENEIINLMDSIMRGYPFGTFLFWKIKKEDANNSNYSMYEFIRRYHEKDRCINPPAKLYASSNEDFIHSVLDGQQRLTSLYIALMGSLSLKIPKKRWNNDDAFPEKELYINLIGTKQNEDDDLEFDFKFLSNEEYNIEKNDNTKRWFKVKDVLSSTLQTVKHTARKNGLSLNKQARQNLSLLYKKICHEKLINYYEVSGKSMDDVLVIFVRANSKGIKLSKTDLLFSTVVAHWDNARDEIDSFLSSINKIGDHYEFDTDFIMRTCLYVLDMPILMKIENFNQENVIKIKNNWPSIKSATRDVVNLLKEQGFSAENIISNNAILPIIYYRFQKGEQAFKSPTVKEDFRKYFALSQIKKIFGGHSNQTLEILRNKIRELPQFSFEAIENVELSYENTLACDSDEIEEWLKTFKKGPYTFFLMSLLYPEIKFGQGVTYEQDHMHPSSGFKQKELEKIVLKNGERLSPEEIKDWMNKKDTLPNLEALTDKENEEKLKMSLKEWVSSGHKDKYLPKGNIEKYEFNNFINFYKERKKILKKKLESILLD